MSARLAAVWRSFRGLPLWVRIWVTLLAASNLASLGFLDSAIGVWTAIAMAAVVVLNGPMMVIQGGLTRLMSFPHFVWAPLLVFIYPRLFGADALEPGSPVHIFALAVFTVNGISLAFDIYESIAWLRGGREILGASS
ncbi:MAG: hypothetical protein ACTSUD_01610 [Alphaproteobacteria bacterium]